MFSINVVRKSKQVCHKQSWSIMYKPDLNYGGPEVQNTNANLKTQTQILKHKRKFENTNANLKTQTEILKHKRKVKTHTQILKHTRKF